MVVNGSADEDLKQIIDKLRAQAPHVASEKGEWDQNVLGQGQRVPAVKRLVRSRAHPIAAVDVGMIKLGETPQGIAIAMRGALVTDAMSRIRVDRYFSGPLHLDNAHKATTLHALGQQLDQDDYYVELDRSDPNAPRPLRVRDGVADNARHYADRFRAWYERKIQAEACVAIQDGTVCFDSSLTLSTRDCPNDYLRELITSAHRNGNSVVAVSKMSEIEIMGKSIRWWLDDAPFMACYRPMTSLMIEEAPARATRILGQVYAMRFAAFAPTAFRVDVCAAPGVTDDEAIARFWSSTRVRAYYPDILVRAHIHTTFSRSAAWSLQAETRRVYRTACHDDVSLQAAFGPFSGRFK